MLCSDLQKKKKKVAPTLTNNMGWRQQIKAAGKKNFPFSGFDT
jgi:hypothetical protein